MIDLIKNNSIHFLFVFLLLTYLIGISLTEVFLFTLIIYFLIKNRDFDFLKDKKIILFFLISFFFGINAFLQIDDNLQISSIFHFRYVIFVLSILFCLRYCEKINPIIKKNTFYIILLIVSFVLFDAFFQFLIGKNLFGFNIIKNRISGIFQDELIDHLQFRYHILNKYLL